MGKLDDWLRRKLGGHVSLGPVTVYGFNAMHLAVNVWTERWGSVCFHPDLRFLGRFAPWMLGKEWPWYFYVSKNATPWAATIAVGPGIEHDEKINAVRRWAMWGHNYSDDYNPQAENEFFWGYVNELKREKEMRKAEANGICGACGEKLTPAEQGNSNVCLQCLLKEMERVVSRIREQEAVIRSETTEDAPDPDKRDGWN